MSARVIDLAAHQARREAAPRVPEVPCDRYQMLADEVSAALASVRRGRNSRALRERLDDLANAVRAVAQAELVIGATWDAALEWQRRGGAR